MRAKIISANNDPALYPWTPPSRDTFVSGNMVVPFKGKVTRVPHRYPVVAVGSNACVKVNYPNAKDIGASCIIQALPVFPMNA